MCRTKKYKQNIRFKFIQNFIKNYSKKFYVKSIVCYTVVGEGIVSQATQDSGIYARGDDFYAALEKAESIP